MVRRKTSRGKAFPAILKLCDSVGSVLGAHENRAHGVDAGTIQRRIAHLDNMLKRLEAGRITR